MRKKLLSALLCAVACLWLLPVAAYANSAPPSPSIVIVCRDMGDERFYVALLSEDERDAAEGRPWEDADVWQVFKDYADPDGFFFTGDFLEYGGENSFSLGNYWSESFKLLLYFPAEGRIVSSEAQTCYAYESRYKVALSDDGTALTMKERPDYTEEILSPLARIVFSIAVELLLALPFGLRERKLLGYIAAVNAATQVALNLFLYTMDFWIDGSFFLPALFLMELLIVVVEAALYDRRFKRLPVRKGTSIVYSAIANAASFFLWLLLLMVLPKLFY